MKLLLLDPTEKERSEVFRKICSTRLHGENALRTMLMIQLVHQYVEYYGQHQESMIHSDTASMIEWIDDVIDDALDRLTPEAIEAVTNRHVLFTPQTEILIKHVATIAAKKLELSTIREDVVAGVQRLYGAAAKHIRVAQDA
jgi:hypothetical protein